jgi:toxin YoeB
VDSKFEIIWSPESLKQIKYIKKNGSEKYLNKIAKLILDIGSNPFNGIGKPEHLKYKIPPCWSRRINLKDRLVYRIVKNRIEIISILGHYD